MTLRQRPVGTLVDSCPATPAFLTAAHGGSPSAVALLLPLLRHRRRRTSPPPGLTAPASGDAGSSASPTSGTTTCRTLARSTKNETKPLSANTSAAPARP